jgi:hypothetical protein
MTNYYLKRGDKAIGPVPFERLDALCKAGKIQETTSVATSAKGPWISFRQLRTEVNSVSADNLGGTKASDGDGLFSAGFPEDGIPQIAPEVAVSPYWTSPQNASVSKSRPRTTDSSDFEEVVTLAWFSSLAGGRPRTTDSSDFEEEDASFLVRCFAPWAGENSLARYGNLDRYIKIMKFVTRFLFVLGIIGILLGFLVSTISGIYNLITESEVNGVEVDRTFVFLRMLFMYIVLVIQLALLHIFYIFSMAVCDFFRLTMDVEANTRRNS